MRDSRGACVIGQGSREGQCLAESRVLLLGVDRRCGVDAVCNHSVFRAR